MFKPAPPLPSNTGTMTFANPKEEWRAWHAIEMHGDAFYSEESHRTAHRRNDQAIRVLRGAAPAILEIMTYLEFVTLVKHSHEDGDW